MKKVGQIIIASICIGLSLICIIATISSYSKSMKQYSFDDATENADVNIENICDDSTLIFHSWDEYLAYFSSLPSTVSNTKNSEELVTIPEELPDDIELSSIHVNDECTLLTYSVSRNFNLLNYDTSDDVIMEMTNTFIAKNMEILIFPIIVCTLKILQSVSVLIPRHYQRFWMFMPVTFMPTFIIPVQA